MNASKRADPGVTGRDAHAHVTPEHWAKVVAVFESAISCPPDERDAVVDRACGSDAALRADIASLLAADAGASYLDVPVLTSGVRAVDAVWEHLETGPWTSGDGALDAIDLVEQLQTALGAAYRVERELVGGGMSRVFVAHEVQLGRRVAVKVLPVAIRAGFRLAWFRREVQLAAALRHPHIVPLLTAGESANGLAYYTMPFIEGESLKQRLDREYTLPLDEVVRVLGEVAGALTYAHRRGVIHCDVKPANILVDDEHVLVTDFGIAKALSVAVDQEEPGAAARPFAALGALTTSGRVLGTPAYISPEQATRGQRVDARADVYGLGCVVYEMLTGTLPPPQLQPGHAHGPVATAEPVSARRADLPAALDAVVAKALAHRPEDRWQSATAFAAAVAAAAAVHHPPPTLEAGSRVGSWGRRRAVLATTATLAIGLAAFGVATRMPMQNAMRGTARGVVMPERGTSATFAVASHERSPSDMPDSALGAGTTRGTLAVLPVENRGAPADAFLADGLTEELRDRLRTVAGVRVAARRDDAAVGASAKPVEVGRALGVEYVLSGSARWDHTDAGLGRVHVTPVLTRVRDGHRVWSGRYDADLRDVFAVEGEIGGQVATAMGVALEGSTRAALAARPTQNFQAYTDFLRGESLRRATSDQATAFRQALALYERAVALDPTFALAYARIADLHGSLYWGYMDRSPERLARMDSAAHMAVRLAPGSPDTHLALALTYYRGRRDYDHALAEIATAIALAPNASDLYTTRGLIERRRGHFVAAIAAFERAEVLSPPDRMLASHLAFTYFLMHAYADAARYYERVLALDPAWPTTYADDAALQLAWHGDVAAARRLVHQGLQRSDPGELGARLGVMAPVLVATGSDSRRVLQLVSRTFQNNAGAGLLWQAHWWRQRGDSARARTYADSARVVLEHDVARRPEESGYAHELATAYALLGRADDAMRTSDRAMSLLPATRDAIDGEDILESRAYACTLIGKFDCAFGTLRQLLTMPSFISVPGLRASPMWDPLRADPRFAALLRSGHGATEVVTR